MQLTDLIQVLQQRDARAQQLIQQAQSTPDVRGGRKGTWNVQNNLLHKGLALYIPYDSAVCSQVMRMHHDDVLAGHFGRAKTLELISRKYFWNSMRKDVKEYVKTCIVC